MLTKTLVWLNWAATSVARIGLLPIAWLPGWLSLTIISVATGIVMLVVFKYTSNQRAIQATRNHLKADLLALSLFQDNLRVSLGTQGRLVLGAVRLLYHSIVPMLVMTLPMCLLLGQLSLWYQARPFVVGEEAVVTVRLGTSAEETARELHLASQPEVSVRVGPVVVASEKMVCWSVQPESDGTHQLTFTMAGQKFTKEFAAGSGFMQVSPVRPGSQWTSVLLYPHESPFPPRSVVESIEVAYPERPSWTAGSRTWLAYWFVVSMASAFAARPILGIHV